MPAYKRELFFYSAAIPAKAPFLRPRYPSRKRRGERGGRLRERSLEEEGGLREGERRRGLGGGEGRRVRERKGA